MRAIGTNYYYHTNICNHCERADIMHVGKKSAGWTFHFRGYRIKTGADQNIVSVADWARVFETVPGVLVDEEERVIESPLQFLAELEHPTEAQQRSEDSPERRGHWSPRPDPATEWRDEEGFAFCDRKFS